MDDNEIASTLFPSMANELNIKQEQAQMLVDMRTKPETKATATDFWGQLMKEKSLTESVSKQEGEKDTSQVETGEQAINSVAKELGIDVSDVSPEFVKYAKEKALDSQSIKALAELHNNEMIKMQEKVVEAWKEEAGGIPQDYLYSAREVIKNYDDNKEFVTFLNDTGLGNHPTIIRFLSKVGKRGRNW